MLLKKYSKKGSVFENTKLKTNQSYWIEASVYLDVLEGVFVEVKLENDDVIIFGNSDVDSVINLNEKFYDGIFDTIEYSVKKNKPVFWSSQDTNIITYPDIYI